MTTIREEYDLRPVVPGSIQGLSKIQSKSTVNSVELVGLEVEVENAVNLPGGLNRVWQLVDDGSLRNTGAEFITKPIPASASPVALEYLMNSYLPDMCCFSPRTSVHVHLNVQDITRAQAQDMILLYAIYERLFYKFVGKGRQKNIYCVPLFDCSLLVNMLENGETRNWSKYTGLNTLPIRKYGTLEFRHMHGTTDVEKLSKWVGVICKLKEYVLRTSTKEIRSMIASMNDDFDFAGLLGNILGDLFNVFRYAGPTELNYLQAKQALSSYAISRELLLSANGSSAFYSFKG